MVILSAPEQALPPSLASHSFSLVFELELRTKIFDAFAEFVRKKSDALDNCEEKDADVGIFCRYLKQRSTLALGQMLEILRLGRQSPPRARILDSFALWLKGDFPWVLFDRLPTQKILSVRNRGAHPDPQAVTKAEAEEMAAICWEFLTALHLRRKQE